MGNEPKKVGVLDWIGLVLSIAYIVSPIDLIPDVPGIGWIDDLFVGLIAGLNMLQKTIGQTIPLLSSILKFSKFIILLLGVIIVLLILLLGTTIMGLISK